MHFKTLFLTLCSLHINRSVKLLIDGTFDLGPSWNFQYKLKTIPNFKADKRIGSRADGQQSQYKDEATASDSEIQVDGGETEESNTGAIDDAEEDTHVASRVVAVKSSDDSPNLDVDEEFKVTKLYTTVSRNTKMFEPPRKIEGDSYLLNFLSDIHNKTLRMVANVRSTVQEEAILAKMDELKQRYVNTFDTYLNRTRQHYIKTNLGKKNVILNTINHSDKLLNRLLKRFKIDAEHDRLNSDGVLKMLRGCMDRLKIDNYEDACSKFNICDVGKKFSDFVDDLLSILIRGDDTQIQIALSAIANELKRVDLSKIMERKTLSVFRERLKVVEELSPFEQRVLLIAHKILLEDRHHPFYGSYPEETWIAPTMALYNFIEKFDEHFKLNYKVWSDNITARLNDWISGKGGNISAIVRELFDHVENDGIANLDSDAAADMKAKLKVFIGTKAMQLNFDNMGYIPFQPFGLQNI